MNYLKSGSTGVGQVLKGYGDFSDEVTEAKILQEVGFLKVLHAMGAAAVGANLIYQQTTSRDDDNNIEYHIFGARPYFDGVVEQVPTNDFDVPTPDPQDYHYTLSTSTSTNKGFHFNLMTVLLVAQVLGLLYHLGNLGRLLMGGGVETLYNPFRRANPQAAGENEVTNLREVGRLRTRQMRALYNSIALGLVQLTIMLVIGLQDEWLYVFVFTTHVAYHVSILSIDSNQHRPKRFFGTVSVVVAIAVMNAWFFWSVSRIDSGTLYRPRIYDDELVRWTAKSTETDIIERGACQVENVGQTPHGWDGVACTAAKYAPAVYRRKLPDCACIRDDDTLNPTLDGVLKTTSTSLTYSSCYDASGAPHPDVLNKDGKFPMFKGPLDGTGLVAPISGTRRPDCFDVFGTVVPTNKTINLLIWGHICINIAYVVHLVATKWPQRFFGMSLGNAPREWWLVSQDLGYVLLDFMYMASVPAGVYTVHRELSRASFPHPDDDDKDVVDWEFFQEAYTVSALVIGCVGLLYIRQRFRGNVRERQHVRDGEPTSRRPEVAKQAEAESFINARAIVGMSRGENTPMLGVAYA